MMELFVIFQEGVYRHQCGGVFDDAEVAEAAAKSFRDSDGDSYHHYTVVPLELNKEYGHGGEPGVLVDVGHKA